MYYNNEWGTVCPVGWDDTDASVVCRQLRLGASGRAVKQAYPNGSGPMLLSNVACFWSDHTLAACGHTGLRVTYDYGCSHEIDAGVECYSKLLYWSI